MPVFGGIFNVAEYVVSLGRVDTARVELGMDRPSRAQALEFVKGLVVPFVSLSQVLDATYPENPRTNQMAVMCYATLHIGWTTLFVASFQYPDLSGLATTLFVAAGMLLALIRMGFRATYTLRSNHVADVVASTLVWPQVCAQMRL